MSILKFKHWLSMLFNKGVLIIFLSLGFTFSQAQINRYMVFFEDKAGTVYTLSNPSVYLSQKAIDRRENQNISITELDFPVNQNYVQGLQDIGVKVFFRTRWMNGALVQCDVSLADDIEALSFVQSVELVAPGERLLDSGRKKSTEEEKEGEASGATTIQLGSVGIDSMHRQGYHGEGVTIAVIDAGFPSVNTLLYFEDLINENRIDLDVSYNFVFNTTNVFQYDQHGTKVLSIIAGYEPGVFKGSAYKANFQLYVTEDNDTEYRIEEYNWLFAAERADSAGVDIINSSLGYNTFDDPSMDYEKSDADGNTAVITRAAQFAADRGILVVCAAGNEDGNSWEIITPPADAFDVLTVGNVNLFGSKSFTSSIGPTADGRIKPDIAAFGTNITVVLANGSLATASGTSYSAPLITGLVAGLWQRYPNLTSKEVISVMKRTASQANQPDVFLGWGIPNYVAVKNYLDFTEQENAFVVYPNPFIEILNIRSQNPEEITNCNVELYNMQGQFVGILAPTFNWLNPTYQANLSNLTSGLYLLKIFFKNHVYVVKVVKH